MRIQILKRYLTYSLLVTSFMLPATSARAQERRAQPGEVAVPIVKNTCPKPFAYTLTATTPNVVNADFTPAQLALPRAWLNDAGANKAFLYTFQLRRAGRCCEITRAVLTVKMKSIQGGQSNTSADSGNDGIAIMHQGNVEQPYSQAVYSAPSPPFLNSFPTPTYPFQPGQPSTKQWTITGTALNHMNTSHTLSMYAQDDTTVEAASLQIWGCCLSAPQGTTTEESSPIDSPN